MKTAQSLFSLCKLGGKLYATGGYDENDEWLESVECYDPVLDAWSDAPALPEGRSLHRCCAVGDAMYVLGGVESDAGERGFLTNSVLKLDLCAQAWSEVARMPQPRAKFGACVLGSDIYVVGGCASPEDKVPAATTYCYNTVTNLWTTLAPMPEAKLNPSMCVVSGLIYAIGGMSSNRVIMSAFEVLRVVKSVHRFDPVRNAWSTVASLPIPRFGMECFVLGPNIYAVVGFNELGSVSSVERFVVASGSWEAVITMELSEARAEFGAEVVRMEARSPQ